MHPALETRDLTRRFGGLTAVDGLSLTVARGEILGLVGPNGAGKTTLFDLLAGSVVPSSGRILLGGADITAAPAHRRLGLGLGRTFQIPRPFPELTLLDNLLLARQNQSGERLLGALLRPGRVRAEEAAARERAMALLGRMTLAPLAGEPARVLSGGQRKLLELARVMMAAPRVVLLDEPAAGVNPTLRTELVAQIRALNAEGVTFVLIEHDFDMVARLCDRVLVMAQGRRLTEGSPDEIRRDRAVIDAYLGGVAA